MLLHKFDMLTMGIAEAEPDVFLMLACNFYTTQQVSPLQESIEKALEAGWANEGRLLCV